jgi:hypothetical protein
MRQKWSLLLALALLSGSNAWSDTVTTTDNLSVNGRVTMSDSVVVLEAEFSSGVKTLRYDINRVKSIEFNSIIRNSLAPSKVMSLGPSQRSTSTEQAVAGSAIKFRGSDGEGKSCKLVRIDLAQVHCDPGDSQYARAIVLRIVVASQ